MKKDALKRLVAASRHPMRMEQVIGSSAEEGIYLGMWSPKKLGKVFNVYADKKDMMAMWTYRNLVGFLKRQDIWNGVSCGGIGNESELHAALKKGTYNGGWVIPPMDILRRLYEHRHTGAFDGTFNTEESRQGLEQVYMSSSAAKGASNVLGLEFSNGIDFVLNRQGARDNVVSCRLVRFLPV